MEILYINQSRAKIRVTCGVNVTGALQLKIKYKKPSGATGEWTALVETALTGVIYYDLASTATLDELGIWTVWPWIKFSDGREAPGTPDELMILDEGEDL
jgi:hypothetical protein